MIDLYEVKIKAINSIAMQIKDDKKTKKKMLNLFLILICQLSDTNSVLLDIIKKELR